MLITEVDPKTGLLTEKAFIACVASRLMALDTKTAVHPRLAVLTIAMDQPHAPETQEVGNTVLRLAAERLRGAMRSDDCIALTDQGRFRIILEPLNQPEVAASLAAKVCQVLRTPFVVEQRFYELSASVGLSLFPSDGASAARLLHRADRACTAVAAKGGNAYQFSDVGLDPALAWQAELEDNPREAMQRDEFELYYQPRMSLHSGELVGAEALLRWQHPRHGLIAPTELIALAESTGLIHDLGIWVLRRACRQAMHWQRQGYPPFVVSVNVSPRQLDRPEFPQRLSQLLLESGLPPSQLELEITEQAMMRDPEQVIQTLQSIRDTGVAIALDDFGTGYSSLAYLRRFPLDSLKLDRRFLVDVAGAVGDEIILQSIVDLAHALSLNVVAEGVETGFQYDLVKRHGCDEIQGYLVARPMPASAFQARFLARRHGSQAAGSGLQQLAREATKSARRD